MEIAEKLYNRGYISYPRTETNFYSKNIDLFAIVKELSTSRYKWGPYAKKMYNNLRTMKYFDHPRNGKNDDKAHPPIHPVKNPNNAKLTGPE